MITWKRDFALPTGVLLWWDLVLCFKDEGELISCWVTYSLSVSPSVSPSLSLLLQASLLTSLTWREYTWSQELSSGQGIFEISHEMRFKCILYDEPRGNENYTLDFLRRKREKKNKKKKERPFDWSVLFPSCFFSSFDFSLEATHIETHLYFTAPSITNF